MKKTPKKPQNVWLYHPSSTHKDLAQTLPKLINNPSDALEWMAEGITYLLSKTDETDDPKSYRLIRCLPTTYKLITYDLTNCTYSFLEENNILPLENGYQRSQILVRFPNKVTSFF